MAKYIIISLTFVLSFICNDVFAQYSIGGGASSFHGLNQSVNRFGFNAFVEIPRTHRNTLMVRASYMLPVTSSHETAVSAKPGVTPSMADAEEIAKTTYFAIDGGTRYYFINDYDIGFAMYGGGYLKGILSSYGASYRIKGGLNPDDYETNEANPQPLDNINSQYSLLFAFGGSIGVKYQLPTKGALLFDAGIELINRLMDPYAILGQEISQVSFSLHLAYRFDWY